jgi:hypothetical protein
VDARFLDRITDRRMGEARERHSVDNGAAPDA